MYIKMKISDDYGERYLARKRQNVRRFNYTTNKKLKAPPKVFEMIDLTVADQKLIEDVSRCIQK